MKRNGQHGYWQKNENNSKILNLCFGKGGSDENLSTEFNWPYFQVVDKLIVGLFKYWTII